MTQKIIFPNGSGGVAIITPSGALPIEEVVRKDVPAGRPYLLVDAADIPADDTFKLAWEADFSAPDGTGIGPEAWFIEQYQAEITAIEAESAPVAPPIADPGSIEDFGFRAPPEAPAPLEPLAKEDVPLPEGASEDDRDIVYATYLAALASAEEHDRVQFEAALAAWEDEREAAFAAHVAAVQSDNAHRLAEHEKVKADWEADRIARISDLSHRIAAMEQQAREIEEAQS